MTEFLHFDVIFQSSWSACWPVFFFQCPFFSFFNNVFVHKFEANLAVSFTFYCSQLDFLHLDTASQVY